MKTLIKKGRIVLQRVFTKLIVIVVTIIALGSIATAGERGPGPYAGIVIFDHWDTCYIYSGAYLMYLAAAEKESLRKYSGQSILIDAKEVVQPLNPGDGLISKFEIVGPAEVKENLPNVNGLILEAMPDFGPGKKVSFELTIENQTDKMVKVSTGDLAPTLLGERNEDTDLFSPSDGKSDAKITRCNLSITRCFNREKFSFTVKNQGSLPESVSLMAGQKRHFIISIAIPTGNYDFLFGYGGGVHEGKGIASNIVSFAVNRRGKARLLSSEIGTALIKNNTQTKLEKLLFTNFAAQHYFLTLPIYEDTN